MNAATRLDRLGRAIDALGAGPTCPQAHLTVFLTHPAGTPPPAVPPCPACGGAHRTVVLCEHVIGPDGEELPP
jgi:hypothetical protein